MRTILAVVVVVVVLLASSVPTSALNSGCPSTGVSKGDEIACLYNVPDFGWMLRAAVPRLSWGSGDVSQPALTVNYAIGVGTIAAIGILLMFLSLFTCIFICSCRCCCKTCGAQPLERKPTPAALWVPYFIGAFFCLALVAFAGMGIWYNREVSKVLVLDDDSIGNTALQLVDNGRGLIHQVNDTLQLLHTQVPGIADRVRALLNESQVLEVGARGLLKSVGTLSHNMQGLNITVALYNSTQPTRSFPCLFCQMVGAQLANASAQIASEANPIFQSMNTTVHKVRSSLLDIEHQILSQIDSASHMLSDVDSQAVSVRSTTQTIVNDVKYYDGFRNPSMIGIFCLALLTVVIYALAGGFRKPWLFEFDWVWCGIVMFVAWLFFAIHMPAALGLTDGCVYLHDQEPTIQTRFSQDTVKVVDACLLNTSLVDALNLTHYLNFSNVIQFPVLPSVGSAFQFEDLHRFQAQVSNLTLATFEGFVPYCLPETLQALNNLTAPRVFGANNVTSCDPTQFPHPSEVQAAKAAVINCIRERIALQTTLDQIKSNTTAVLTAAAALSNSTSVFQTKVFNTMHTLLNPILADGQHIYAIGYCGFVGAAYYQIKVDMCNRAYHALAYISLDFFMIAVLAFAIAVISMVLTQRFGKTRAQRGKDTSESVPLVAVKRTSGPGTDRPLKAAEQRALLEQGQLQYVVL